MDIRIQLTKDQVLSIINKKLTNKINKSSNNKEITDKISKMGDRDTKIEIKI